MIGIALPGPGVWPVGGRKCHPGALIIRLFAATSPCMDTHVGGARVTLRFASFFAEPHAESRSLQRSGRSRVSDIAICQLTTVLVRINGNPNWSQWLPVPEYVRS